MQLPEAVARVEIPGSRKTHSHELIRVAVELESPAASRRLTALCLRRGFISSAILDTDPVAAGT